MKSFIKLLGILALALLPTLSSAALQTGKVQVGKVSGTVTIMDSKAQRKPLANGATFQEGSLVETGANSTAELVFSNGASVVLTPNTLIELRTFRQVASADITDPYRQIEKDPSPSVTELEVPRGKIIGEVRKLNALSTFTVKTPAGLVRIRGTVFTVEYVVCIHGYGNFIVECVRGSVETTVAGSDAGPVNVDPATRLTNEALSSAIMNNIAKASSAPNSAGPLIKISDSGQIKLYPIPAEDMAELATFLASNSTLPPEVAASINSMSQAMPTRAKVFGGDAAIVVCAGAAGHTPATPPVKEFDMATKGTQEAAVAGKKGATVAPTAPMSTTTGGSRSGDDTFSSTLDETLKKITDNVERTVEQKQINPTPTGS